MNFRELDFHVSPSGKSKDAVVRLHLTRINHIIDSIFLRTPKGLTTDLFSKLNVTVWDSKVKQRFWHFERIGYVEYFDPNAKGLLLLPQEDAVPVTRRYLLKGITFAARHDPSFAAHLPLLRQLIKTAHRPYDYRTGVVRSSNDRRLKAELIIRIQPNQYLWYVEIIGKQGMERLTLKQTEPLFPYFTRFKLQWDNNEIQLLDQAGKLFAHGTSALASS